jgi:hypothetical protein
MPIRADPAHQGKKRALCINCPDTTLTMPNCRFTLQPDDGYSAPQPLPLFAASCTKCGYTELYLEGYLVKTDNASKEAP